MCQKCNNPLCFGGCAPAATKRTPPANLTDADLQRGGWNQDVSDADLQKFKAEAEKAIQNTGWPGAWGQVVRDFNKGDST